MTGYGFGYLPPFAIAFIYVPQMGMDSLIDGLAGLIRLNGFL
jgi:hypothetical protein